jgi:hypothetical protein
MKVIREIVCSKCGKKQTKDVEGSLPDNLFWRVCEFCNRYGLTLVTRRKLTAQEWMEALFFSIGFRVAETEVFIRKLLKDSPPV